MEEESKTEHRLGRYKPRGKDFQKREKYCNAPRSDRMSASTDQGSVVRAPQDVCHFCRDQIRKPGRVNDVSQYTDTYI